MKQKKYSNEKIDEMLRNMSNGKTPVNFEFAGEKETKEEKQKTTNIVLIRRFVPIAAAFVFVIAATVVGVKFLGKGPVQPKDPSNTVVTEIPSDETAKAPIKGSSGTWEYLEYETSITLTQYNAGNPGDKIMLVIPDEIEGKPVTDISEEMFKNLSEKNIKIDKWNISEYNKYFTIVDDVLFNKNMTTLISFDNYDKKSYIIPDGVERIGAFAFGGKFLAFKEITFPDSLRSIGDNAFLGCQEIEEFKLPNGLRYIGDGAFGGCNLLRKINIPSTVEVIETSVFSSCYSLEEIHLSDNKNFVMKDNVLFNKDMTVLKFATCNMNEEYVIPNTVTTVEDGAFGNSTLKKLVFSSSMTTITRAIFVDFYDGGQGCNNLETVIIPNGVTTIVDYAFSECAQLTNIEIPKSVTSIGYSAFGVYTNNESASVWLKNQTAEFVIVGDGVLINYNGNSKDVVIPSNVKYISSAFCGKNIESVTIPSNVTGMCTRAFSDCYNLVSVNISSSVTTIGDFAFSSCPNLTAINVNESNPNYASANGVLFNKDKTTLTKYPEGKSGAYIIPDSVTSICDGAFSNCSNLTSATIPNSVTSIGNSAFSYCSNLTSVTISNSVTSIDNSAFSNCSENLIIYGTAGSYAETYAQENNFQFIAQ